MKQANAMMFGVDAMLLLASTAFAAVSITDADYRQHRRCAGPPLVPRGSPYNRSLFRSVTVFFKENYVKRVFACACAFALLGSFASAQAGTGIGVVGQVIVGRQGNQVMVQLLNSTITSFPCASSDPVFNFAFLTSTSGGKDMLAAVLTAKANGVPIQIVGTATCAIDTHMEDAAYVWMLN